MNATALRNEIAHIKRRMHDWNIEGRLDSDTEAEMIGEIEDLQGELHLIEDAAPAGFGGLNIPLFVAAIGATPEELGW